MMCLAQLCPTYFNQRSSHFIIYDMLTITYYYNTNMLRSRIYLIYTMALDNSSLEMIILNQISLFILILLLTQSVKYAQLALVLKAIICIYKQTPYSGNTIGSEQVSEKIKDSSTTSMTEYKRYGLC